jgi:glycosyltransferase involved in cell wall biosynthesis
MSTDVSQRERNVPDGACTVTVAVPTRDRWVLACRALRSALRQRSVDLEVVMVDDGSRKRAGDEPELRDPRVRVVRHDEPRGVAAARNTAIARARGRWIAFLDDDDIWAPDKLVRQIELAEEVGADFVWTAQGVVDGDLTVTEVYPAVSADAIATTLLEVNRIGGPSSVLVRSSALDALGCFDERLSLLADWDLWLRLASTTRGAALAEVVTAYSVHPDNMHLRHMNLAVSERAYLAAKHRQLSVAHGIPLGGRAFWEWVALGYRRRHSRVRAAVTYLRAWRGSRRPRDLARAAGVLLGEKAMSLGAMEAPVAAPVDLGWIAEAAAPLAESPVSPGSVPSP